MASKLFFAFYCELHPVKCVVSTLLLSKSSPKITQNPIPSNHVSQMFNLESFSHSNDFKEIQSRRSTIWDGGKKFQRIYIFAFQKTSEEKIYLDLFFDCLCWFCAIRVWKILQTEFQGKARSGFHDNKQRAIFSQIRWKGSWVQTPIR